MSVLRPRRVRHPPRRVGTERGLVDASHDGVWELPVLGEIAAPPAVLIRPDGHVAWTGYLTDPELPQALATWFGASTPAH
ncbi:MAG: hypothetical protein ACR2ME_10325 [Acidimicrobiia bacterium]